MNENQFPPVSEVLTRLAADRLEVVNAAAKLGKMPFHDAALAWLETRKPFIGKRTFKDYTDHIATLAKFFGHMRLEQICKACGAIVEGQVLATETMKPEGHAIAT
jgi:hypothetical protein